MRWTPKQLGDTRIRSWFAWVPACSCKSPEYRWLERVTVLQTLREAYPCSRFWENTRFIDPDDGGVE